MGDPIVRLSSRKFLLALAAAAYATVQAALGAITPDQALDAVKVAVLAYIAAEGVADVAGRIVAPSSSTSTRDVGAP